MNISTINLEVRKDFYVLIEVKYDDDYNFLEEPKCLLPEAALILSLTKRELKEFRTQMDYLPYFFFNLISKPFKK